MYDYIQSNLYLVFNHEYDCSRLPRKCASNYSIVVNHDIFIRNDSELEPLHGLVRATCTIVGRCLSQMSSLLLMGQFVDEQL